MSRCARNRVTHKLDAGSVLIIGSAWKTKGSGVMVDGPISVGVLLCPECNP